MTNYIAEATMRGDRYDDYVRQLRRDECDRLFRLLGALMARLWGRAATSLRRRVRYSRATQHPG